MNIFLCIIKENAIPNKYTRWYISIIEAAKIKNRTSYTENHHIVPKSFSKELNVPDINNLENLVELSAKEHFICHRLLTKMFSGKLKQKMSYAIHRLSYSNNSKKSETYVSARHYESIRKQHSVNLSGEGNPMYGRTHSQETRNKISIKAKGRVISDELRDHYSTTRRGENNAMFGHTHSEESRQRISAGRKGKCVGEDNIFFGKHHTEETRKLISDLRKNEPKIECIYCGKITNRLNHIRWHGDNCKKR